MGSIVLLAVGHRKSYLLQKGVTEYFRTNNLHHILVCDSGEMKDSLKDHEQIRKYERMAIIALKDLESSEELEIAGQLKRIVRRIGVMQYPCLLTLEDKELKGRYFTLDH
jgi:hypothetical protein